MSALAPEEMHLMQSKKVGDIQNAQTVTTTGGGYLIPQGFSDKLEEALKWFGGILGEVDVFETETGQPLPWPTDNDTANKGRMLAINTQLTETDITFGQVTFNAYTGTSDIILVPIQLMQDSYFDLDTYLARKLGTRLGRLLNYQATVGSGSSAPTGIQTATITAGNTTQGTTGETTSCIYNDLVNTLHLVDPATAPGLAASLCSPTRRSRCSASWSTEIRGRCGSPDSPRASARSSPRPSLTSRMSSTRTCRPWPPALIPSCSAISVASRCAGLPAALL